jgi:hypothetical protein
MSEDLTRARQLVAEDIANAVGEFGPIDAVAISKIDTVEAPENRQFSLVIGTRDQLTKREADSAGKAFKVLRSRHPRSRIMLFMLGYDQDPRELWEFPEVCRYVRRFARTAGLSDWRVAVQVPWGFFADAWVPCRMRGVWTRLPRPCRKAGARYLAVKALLLSRLTILSASREFNDGPRCCPVINCVYPQSVSAEGVRRPMQSGRKRHQTRQRKHCNDGQTIDTVEEKTEATRKGSAARMRRCRARRRAGYRCFTVEIHRTEIEALVRHRLLEVEDRDDPDAVVTALYQFLERSMGRPS